MRQYVGRSGGPAIRVVACSRIQAQVASVSIRLFSIEGWKLKSKWPRVWPGGKPQRRSDVLIRHSSRSPSSIPRRRSRKRWDDSSCLAASSTSSASRALAWFRPACSSWLRETSRSTLPRRALLAPPPPGPRRGPPDAAPRAARRSPVASWPSCPAAGAVAPAQWLQLGSMSTRSAVGREDSRITRPSARMHCAIVAPHLQAFAHPAKRHQISAVLEAHRTVLVDRSRDCQIEGLRQNR